MSQPNTHERLFGRATRQGDCLVFPGGSPSRSGHRQIWFEGGMRLAHRIAWTITRGPIPDGLCVLHRCDNPPCIDPEHLFLGTVQDNNADRDAKGRGKVPSPEQAYRRKPGPIAHGTLTAYVKRKCRCEACRRANREYRSGLRAAGLDHLGQPVAVLPAAQRAALDAVAWPTQTGGTDAA